MWGKFCTFDPKMNKIWQIIAFLCVGAGVISCQRANDFRSNEGVVWNTTYHIVYQSPVDMGDSILSVFREVDRSLSVFNDTSVVSRINRNSTDEPDDMFREVFEESKRVNMLSYGAFDPTVGPLVDLWGFGRQRDSVRTVSPELIDSILRCVGINDCMITDDGRLVKKHPGTLFNFSAIAKGYGCDKVGDMLSRNGIDCFMVEVGGEIVVKGHNPRNADWRIMIDAPVESSDSVIHERMAVIAVTDCAVATSGNYRNFKEVDGKRVGHTIDPFTGSPAHSEVLSVTVVAPRCMTADALATACMAMPLDSAKAMIERIPEVSALFVTASRDSTWNVVTTSRFPME